MAIRSYKVGPGTLTLTPPAGAAFDATAQLTSCTVEWSESTTSEDTITTLSNETIAGSDTASYAAKLGGKVLQDLETAGFVAFTWANKGVVCTFTFKPLNTAQSKITGSCRVIPLTVGGDVKSRPDSDFSWACPVDPQLVANP